MIKAQPNKHRIAIVANTSWNIHNFRMNVLKKLIDEGFSVYVISPQDNYSPLIIRRFPGLHHIPLVNLHRRGINPINDIKLLIEISRIFREIKPDIVLNYTVKPNIYGAFAGALHRIPSLAVITGLGYPFINKGLITSITKFLYKLSSRFHKKIIFENQEDLQLFENLNLIKDQQGVSLKGCGVNIAHFKPQTDIKKEKSFVFTFIGRLLFDKGIREFALAAQQMVSTYSKVKFWIIGNFDDQNPASVSKDELNKWLIPDKITYLGFQQDIKKYISLSDCVVLPSYREAIARTLTEAMAMEKPVITADSPGCIETVNHGINGLIVPAKDHHALFQAFEKILKLPEEDRKIMGKKGREKVLMEYDDRLIADQIYTLVQNTLNPNQKNKTIV